MGRTKDPDLVPRDRSIVLELREGKSRAELCAKYGLSQARLSQIVTETAPTMPDEAMRSWLMLKYEQIEEQLAKHASSKGRPMFSGQGGHNVDSETGDFAYDASPAIQAADIRLRALAGMSKLYGVDKPPPKPQGELADLNEYFAEHKILLAENTALREQIFSLQAQVQALEGSVPAELVPHQEPQSQAYFSPSSPLS